MTLPKTSEPLDNWRRWAATASPGDIQDAINHLITCMGVLTWGPRYLFSVTKHQALNRRLTAVKGTALRRKITYDTPIYTPSPAQWD